MTGSPTRAPITDLDVVCYYHDPDKVPLLHHVVLPTVARLDQFGLAVHVERHWLHGPHLRMRISRRSDTVTATTVTAAAQTAVAALRDRLAAHPSKAEINPADLLRQAVIAGRAELVSGPYEPIHPDNTVRIEPPADDQVRRLLGSAAAVECRADLLRTGLVPVGASVADLIRHGSTNGRRVRLAMTAMTVHAAHYPDGYAYGYQTFLSHLEDFLHLQDPDGRLRTGFDRQWQQRAAPVTAEVARLITAAGRTDDPVAQAWAHWEREAWSSCRAAHTRGELPVLPGEQYAQQARTIGDPATVRRWDPKVRTEYSRYHQALRKLDFLKLPGVEESFPPYRFATNVLYLLLALCDITPLERYLAAYLFSQAVQRLTGVTWQEGMRDQLTELEERP